MPPFLPRKRSPPPALPQSTAVKRAKLTDALDAEATNNVPSLRNQKTFSLGSDDSSSSESSLSDVDSDQFEDVPVLAKKPETSDESEEDSDQDVEWEDAAAATPAQSVTPHIPMANGPIQITLRKDDEDVIDYGTAAKAGSGKKGPSKREKHARIVTHQLHVQFLLLHNAIRNKWIQDKEVQDILVKQLPPQILKEVKKWKRASGLTVPDAPTHKSGKGRKRYMTKQELERSQRDWGQPSQRLEAGKPDMSHGDPLIMLLRVLSAYWKKRFAITAPGLRKRGYGTKHGLKQDIASLRNDKHDPERHGEIIKDLEALKKIAEKGEGSRDVGAQLFTALLRGLGIGARIVASLQPSGYGWTKVEQMVQKRPVAVQIDTDSSEDDTTTTKKGTASPIRKKTKITSQSGSRRPKVISLDTDEDEIEVNDVDASMEDDDSVVDVTPSMPKQQKPKYDRDLLFPIYWTEAISPITNKVFPVSPLVLEIPVAATDEALTAFEPRGAKAENGRQVMAYVVAYSPDGTAKDVTVRYLRKRVWPGKTKGFRLPIEKVPIYDAKGKIKRHEDFDWFKYALRPYTRPDTERTAVDDMEDTTDLVPQESEKKNNEDGVDTLQSLKTSADFVLEKFLRREEALRPDAKPIRMFTSGKGDKQQQEPVYRRADVERCLTAESWHKEGRKPKLGETPMKMVPVRAVTLTRKREAEEHYRQYGEKQTQGLYAWDQTEWIIPPPIQDGIIPKNSYGNMDCFVPSMVPQGAVHVPLKGTVRICKKLEIDFAEAVTGFEFGNKRAVPVCTGVVIAKENERLVKDAWREWNEEQRRKEETKLEKLTLDLWRKFVLGLRIRERVQDMYGEDIGDAQDLPTGFTRDDAIAIDDEDHHGAGFVNEEEDEEMGGGFLLPHEEEVAPMEELIMDHEPSQASGPSKTDVQYPMPSSESSRGKQKHHDGHKLGSSSISTSSDGSRQGLDDCEVSDQSEAIQRSNDLRTHSRPSKTRRANHEVQSSSEKISSDRPDRRKAPQGRSHRTKVEDSSDDDEAQNSKDTDEDDDEDQDEEKYDPRPTRTRGKKSTSSSTPISTPRAHGPRPKTNTKASSAAKLTSRSKRISGATLKADSDDDEADGGIDSSSKPADDARRGRGRGRGRPRKTKPSDVVKADGGAPKRSRRLTKRESTIITSPYFKQGNESDDSI